MGKGTECDVPEFLNSKEFRALFDKFTSRQFGEDFDLYLMENNIWPLLLDALNELAKRIEFDAERHQLGDFDAITWLAQYFVRNHPKKSFHKDKNREGCFNEMQGFAHKEFGRREL